MEKQAIEKSKHRILNIIAFIFSAIAFMAAIWIVVPAPSYDIWLFSVAASEWSFVLGALAFLGTLVSLIFGRGKIKFAAVFIGAIALFISLYPFFSAFSAARKQNVQLSFRQYVSGFWLADENQISKKTYAFAEVDGKVLELDVYSPPDKISTNGAAVIVVHGGSWSAGERSDFPQWNAWLAENGFTVFDIDYRLALQPNWQTATGDVKCAVGWVKKNAAQFNISPERIVLLGRSAGAHLALLAAYSATDKSFSPSCPNTPEASENPTVNENVRAVVSFYAPVDLLWSFDNPANQSVIDGPTTLSNFLGGNPHESNEIRERFLLASPTARINAQTPPTLLIHGGRDQLVRSENMDLLAEKLKESNAPHKVLFISYAQHGFDYNFNGWGAQLTKSVLLDFLQENLK